MSSSILEYRTIKGRTFHSERHDSQYFTPNDPRQNDSMDMTYVHVTRGVDAGTHTALIAASTATTILPSCLTASSTWRPSRKMSR